MDESTPAMTLTISVLCGMEGVDRFKAAAITMAILCILLLAQAAAQAAVQPAPSVPADASPRYRRRPRQLAELDPPSTSLLPPASFMQLDDGVADTALGMWQLSPLLLQLV